MCLTFASERVGSGPSKRSSKYLCCFVTLSRSRASEHGVGKGRVWQLLIAKHAVIGRVRVVLVGAAITPPGLIVIVGLNFGDNGRNRGCELLAKLIHGSGGVGQITTGLILIYLLLFGRGHFGVLRLRVK